MMKWIVAAGVLVGLLVVLFVLVFQARPRYVGDPSPFKYKVVITDVGFLAPNPGAVTTMLPGWHTAAFVPDGVSMPHVYRHILFVNAYEIEYDDLPASLVYLAWPKHVLLKGTVAEWVKQENRNFKLVQYNYGPEGYEGYPLGTSKEIRIIRQEDGQEIFNSTEIIAARSYP